MDLHEVMMREETTSAAAMEKFFTYLAMGIGECIDPAYGKSYIVRYYKKHKGTKCVDMVTPSYIAYLLMWRQQVCSQKAHQKARTGSSKLTNKCGLSYVRFVCFCKSLFKLVGQRCRFEHQVQYFWLLLHDSSYRNNHICLQIAN